MSYRNHYMCGGEATSLKKWISFLALTAQIWYSNVYWLFSQINLSKVTGFNNIILVFSDYYQENNM